MNEPTAAAPTRSKSRPAIETKSGIRSAVSIHEGIACVRLFRGAAVIARFVSGLKDARSANAAPWELQFGVVPSAS